MAEPEFVRPSLQSAIEDLGYLRPHRRKPHIPPIHAVRARNPRPRTGEWIVQIQRTSYSTKGTPIHALETICSASRHIFPIGQIAGIDEF